MADPAAIRQLLLRRESEMKKSINVLSIVLMSLIFCLCFLQPAFADKKSDTLNIAFTKELETLDRYFNTAREGIVISRHAFDNLLYRDPVTYEYKGSYRQRSAPGG